MTYSSESFTNIAESHKSKHSSDDKVGQVEALYLLLLGLPVIACLSRFILNILDESLSFSHSLKLKLELELS
jgi:hypothetical protein